jgi:outer membrane protein OmpA-like peptidoglycan-associated protein
VEIGNLGKTNFRKIQDREENMNKIITMVGIVFLLFLTTNLYAAHPDEKGCKDSPLFTRMPGSWIYRCEQKTFDAFNFITGTNPDTKTSVEGKLWTISYTSDNDLAEKPSELQILRNYENAAQKLDGTLIFSNKDMETLKLTKDGKEFWVQVVAEFPGKYGLVIVQKDAMKQDIEANAEVYSNDIRAKGHAAVYGINFDTGKSTIKPESAQVIGEIAKLLNTDSGLKLNVVGHTDNVGGVESNIRLSQDRAEAILQALVHDRGIAASRLRAYGCGQFAPVASNDTDDGRAKNRRVELVKQ